MPKEKTFAMLYKQHNGFVLFVAKRMGLSAEVSEDVAHDVFLKLWAQLDQGLTPDEAKPWLAVVTRNRALDLIRQQARHKTSSVGHDDYLLERTGEEQMEGHHRVLLARVVEKFVDEVAQEKGGETFRAFYGDGKGVKEIAEANGETVSSVTTRLTRLRRKFKDRLKKLVDEAIASGEMYR